MSSIVTPGVPTRSRVTAAFVQAQAEMTNPAKDKTAKVPTKSGGSYSYAYTDLASVLDHVRPVLAKHELAVVQDVRNDDGRLSIYTVILHSSGEELRFGPIQGDAGREWQTLGSGITYGRRYALLAALGLAADEDDDGASAPARRVEREPSRPATTPEPTPGKPRASDDQLDEWAGRIVEAESLAELNAVAHDIAAYDVGDAHADLVAAYSARKAVLDA